VGAILGSSSYTNQFYDELEQPGPRVPITRDANLFFEAVTLGRRIIELHTYSESDAGASHGKAKVLKPIGRDRPNSAGYDATEGVVRVGDGAVGPVGPGVGNYQVSGMRVIDQWLGYRRLDPAGRTSSDLDSVIRSDWPAEWTSELLELIWTIEALVDLEPSQALLLGRVLESELISVDDLKAAGILPIPDLSREEPPVSVVATLPFG